MGVVSSLSVDSKKAPTKGCTYRNNSMWQDSGEHAHFIHTGVVTGIDSRETRSDTQTAINQKRSKWPRSTLLSKNYKSSKTKQTVKSNMTRSA